MGATTLFWCLVGQRRAILRVAETRYAVWVGLLLVISAGFARDYDREDLWHEPWNLLPPVGASLVSSFLLFSMLWRSTVRAERLQEGDSFLRAYRVFLGLFWMTAPLAWLYALPVERFLSEVDATQVNLLLLGIVATWRVILMNRMASILFGGSFAQTLPVVMLFADTAALFLLFFAPVSGVSSMSGVAPVLSESEELILSTVGVTYRLAIYTWPLWLITTIIVISSKRLSINMVATLRIKRTAAKSVWALCAMSILIWGPVLLLTQPEQQLKRLVERDLRSGHFDSALATMSKHERGDFPPHWNPVNRRTGPSLEAVLGAIVENDTKPWVFEMFVGELARTKRSVFYPHWDLDSDGFDRFLGLLEQLPGDFPIVSRYEYTLAALLHEGSTRGQEQQARIKILLKTIREHECRK